MNRSISTIRRSWLPLAAGVVVLIAILVGAFGRANHALAAGSHAGALGTCTINWTGTAADNQWTTAANWSPVRIPGSTDYACIPSTSTQAVTISAGTNIVKGVNSQGSSLSVTTGSLELTDSTQSSGITALSLFGSTMKVDTGASLSLSGSDSWTGGDITGSGTTTIASGATLAINVPSGNGAVLHGGHTLANQGTVNWLSGAICLSEAAVINNQNLAHFNAQAGDGWNMGDCLGGAAPRFHNLSGGTITRNGTGAERNNIGVPFDNDGTVQLTAGQLGLADNSSGSSDSGTYSLASGTYLVLNGPARTFGAGASVSGAGVLFLNAGTTVFTSTRDRKSVV